MKLKELGRSGRGLGWEAIGLVSIKRKNLNGAAENVD